MAGPSSIAESELEELQNAIAEYPYFQLGYTFIAKARHDQQAPDADKNLSLAAVYAPSRRRLKLIFDNELQTKAPSENEAPPEQPQSVSSENPVETVTENVAEIPAEETQYGESGEKDLEVEASAAETDTKDNASREAIYKELEENLQHLRESRLHNQEEDTESGHEDDPKKKIASDNPEKPVDQSREAGPEAKKDVQGHGPYLLDYLKDIEPIQSDRLGIHQKQQMELIDKFMNADRNVRLRWRYQEQEPEDLSDKNQVSADHFVTENLADIYVKQGKKEKALEIYEKLILKFPHKKTYFAEKIESLKEN